ncbi:hypothetical protein [Sphingomonas sp. LHG3406-1]|uniref:hypothetical protein n=1 Tax=Sphingomonas sp. LHG3406-1 TaxID=2804617 RepID=UPI002615E9C9|nr:hypothetical protein [Sphingomonas sp. LHG3406-1]
MANPAINAALIAAAQQQAASARLITDPLKKARATNSRAAIPLDLSAKGTKEMLDYLVKRGDVRDSGGGRYWIDEEAIARSKASATRFSLILIVFLLSVGASLWALVLS